MKKYITILATAMLLIACGGEKQETNVRPLKTEVKGDLADYISVIDDTYTITKQEGGLGDDWQINFRLKRKKDTDITNNKVDFKLVLVNKKGMPVMGNENFRMATGLWSSNSELSKFKSFLKNKNETEEWFTLNLNTFKKQYKETLPKDATHFVIRTIVEDLKQIKKAERTEEPKKKYTKNDVIGLWKGNFGKNTLELKITEVVDNLDDHYIKGTNTVKGNTRKVVGDYTITKGSNIIEAVLNEPGDNKYDGVFHIYFDLKENTAKGSWQSNNNKLKRNFILKKVRAITVIKNAEITNTNVIEKKNNVSSKKVDELIDNYEKYVTEYINFIGKIEKGDLNAYTKSLQLMNKANNFYTSINGIKNKDFTVKQVNRLNAINLKMLGEASKIQSKF